MTFLLNPHRFATASPATIAFVSGSVSGDSVGRATYTYSSHPIGTATSTRIVAVSIHAEINAEITTVTIGGSAATVIQHTADAQTLIAVAYLLVTSGTTADIVVNFTATINSCSIVVHEVNTTTAVPSDNDSTDGGTSLSLTALTVPTDGVALCAGIASTPAHTYTWTGATETSDQDLSFRNTYSTATTDTSGTNTITAAATGGDCSLIGVAWGP